LDLPRHLLAWIDVRAKHLVPNAFTLANITFGFLGVVAATNAHFELACVTLFMAALCDLLDGRLARWLNATSKFGMELDSLSDAVSFGVAPAVLIYLAVLQRLGALGAAVAVAYVLCGALRLARYNCDNAPLSQRTFVGCPIPIAAGYLLTFVMVRDALPTWLVAAGTLLAAVCMVSTLKVPKFRKGGLPTTMMWVGLSLFVIFLVRPGAVTWHAWNGWNMIMILSNYIMLWRHGDFGGERGERPALPRAA
jgi:CDP-diacylglycerol--serine O-phosphatidyltransferase